MSILFLHEIIVIRRHHAVIINFKNWFVFLNSIPVKSILCFCPSSKFLMMSVYGLSCLLRACLVLSLVSTDNSCIHWWINTVQGPWWNRIKGTSQSGSLIKRINRYYSGNFWGYLKKVVRSCRDLPLLAGSL